MAITADTKVRVTGHNGIEHIVPYNRYYTAATAANRKAIELEPPKNVLPKRHAGAIAEREFTLDILGHGESIAVTE